MIFSKNRFPLFGIMLQLMRTDAVPESTDLANVWRALSSRSAVLHTAMLRITAYMLSMRHSAILAARRCPQDHDPIQLNRITVQILHVSMIFFENRLPLFGIML
jgi:hypothetical protein